MQHRCGRGLEAGATGVLQGREEVCGLRFRRQLMMHFHHRFYVVEGMDVRTRRARRLGQYILVVTTWTFFRAGSDSSSSMVISATVVIHHRGCRACLR